MTDIPGTQAVKAIPKEIPKPIEIKNVQALNVKDLKKKPDEIPLPGDEIWYNQLHYWILLGFGISLIFAVMSYFKRTLSFIIFLAPLVSAGAWFAKKYARKLKKQDDILK